MSDKNNKINKTTRVGGLRAVRPESSTLEEKLDDAMMMLIMKFYDNEASPEEASRVQTLLETNQEAREFLSSLGDISSIMCESMTPEPVVQHATERESFPFEEVVDQRVERRIKSLLGDIAIGNGTSRAPAIHEQSSSWASRIGWAFSGALVAASVAIVMVDMGRPTQQSTNQALPQLGAFEVSNRVGGSNMAVSPEVVPDAAERNPLAVEFSYINSDDSLRLKHDELHDVDVMWVIPKKVEK